MLNEYKKKILCIILARKSSKRIKKKNIKIIKKKPLIYWSLKFAKLNFKTSNILVSSDDEKVLNIAKKLKIQNIIRRPKIYCNSKSKSVDAVLHALKKINKKKNIFESILLLQPTSPFRKNKTLNKIIKIFFKNNFKSIVTVSKDIRNNKNLFYLDNKKKFSKKTKKLKVRIDGNLYLAKISFIKKMRNFYGYKTNTYLNKSKLESLDIDINDDWKILEKNKKFLGFY
tara:strand:+ start:314 stop:997 length:684 start_codon:yes stop_codon:yes gene_type:complete